MILITRELFNHVGLEEWQLRTILRCMDASQEIFHRIIDWGYVITLLDKVYIIKCKTNNASIRTIMELVLTDHFRMAIRKKKLPCKNTLIHYIWDTYLPPIGQFQVYPLKVKTTL